MEETAVAVEIGKVLRDLDTHRFERKNRTTLRFPLNRRQRHTTDPSADRGIIAGEDDGQRIVAIVAFATRAIIVAGAGVSRRRDGKQEVKALDGRDAFDFQDALANRLSGRDRATGTRVIIAIEDRVPVIADIGREIAELLAKLELIEHRKEIGDQVGS